jgi:hypothetical protein
MFGTGMRETRDDARPGGDVLPARLATSGTWAWILVAVGVFLRVLEYSDDRRLYFDETDLKENLVGFAFYDFQTPLSARQLAPPGFLAVERLMILLPLPFPPAARLVPFVCSIASMFLMRSVARRYVAAAAVPIAVGLFAMTDWILYYSVEIKQYSSDVALTLTALLLAARALPSREEPSVATSPYAVAILTAFGAIGVWFSHPLALVLAGVGLNLILKSASERHWARTLVLAAMSLAWASSFAACYRVSRNLISDDAFLQSWWAFAYLPFPPRSLAQVKQIFWQSINLFNCPSGIVTPLGILPSAFIGLGLFLLGAWSLGRRWKGGLILLASPILLALAASMAHRYPFHGRLLLFLIPSVYLLVGEGAAALARRGHGILTFALAAFLLAQPVYDVLWYRLVQKRHHGEYDSHGDLHPDVLDFLDGLQKTEALHEMIRKARTKLLDDESSARPPHMDPPRGPSPP